MKADTYVGNERPGIQADTDTHKVHALSACIHHFDRDDGNWWSPDDEMKTDDNQKNNSPTKIFEGENSI